MSQTELDFTNDAPFGKQHKRPAWPLVLWIVLFVAAFAALLWMAVAYPAR